jgi:hypothetical protein
LKVHNMTCSAVTFRVLSLYVWNFISWAVLLPFLMANVPTCSPVFIFL